jgi:dihydrofolate reductase
MFLIGAQKCYSLSACSGQASDASRTGRTAMRRIFLFMNVSLDGYFEDEQHDISAFHAGDDAFEAFSPERGEEVDTILLGHKTYEMMKAFWPTPQAQESSPEIATFMNERLKVVLSHQPFEPGWRHVRVISGDVAGEVRRLKEQPGKAIIIFGSSNACVSLLEAGLLDELQIMVNPIVFGGGTSLFTGLREKVSLTLTQTRAFPSGRLLLTYEPVPR